MARTRSVAAALVLSAGLVAIPATSAFAAGSTTTCDAYSGKCTTVKGHKFTKPPQVDPLRDTRLPFTGAEIAGMVALGGAAVAGGAGIAAAGRRRRFSPA
jgi:hypothetical protein